ncbi:MAG: hypothetical protein K8R54_02590 [Bacteroidales bacterium]|nr:hypothetical protein [Bacteroidales bacterium]
MIKKIKISVCFLLLFSTVYSQEITTILESEYETKMISSGKNYPTVSLEKNNLGDISVLLHHRVPVEDIKKHYNWSDSIFQTKLEMLLKEGLIKKDKKYDYLPTAMVITLPEGEKLKEEAKIFADSVSKMIIEILPEIRKEYAKLKGFKHIDFSRASLFILSNVMLDAWQINNVEKTFLKAERTSRNNMNYYFSFQEKRNNDKREAFNIYGNTSRMYGSILSIFIGKAMNFGIYGNERSGVNFNTLTKKQLQEWFAMKETEDIKSFKKSLLRELLKLSNNPDYKISDTYKSGFSKIDMMKGNILTIPVFNLTDNKKLNKIANLITDNLIDLFEKNRDFLEKNYQNSSYCNEITFEEYFIWWYHIFYTEVTEYLILKNHIKRPATGVFPYIFKI